MKHTEKRSLAIKMAKRGASNVFTSKAWLSRKLSRFLKELARLK